MIAGLVGPVVMLCQLAAASCTWHGQRPLNPWDYLGAHACHVPCATANPCMPVDTEEVELSDAETDSDAELKELQGELVLPRPIPNRPVLSGLSTGG